MTFRDVEARFAQLNRQYANRQMTQQAFEQAVSQLRVRGPDGSWWQMDMTGNWLRWDGRVWNPATPPRQPIETKLASLSAKAYPNLPSQQRKAQPKPPESLLDLLKLFLSGMFKNFFVKVVFAIVTLLFVWVLHTILLIGPNGGFGGAPVGSWMRF